ncbi:MAG: hypothetical protein KDK61_03595 [Simkania sp.]|nr:hypothetical protein [Simkania sp.]
MGSEIWSGETDGGAGWKYSTIRASHTPIKKSQTLKKERDSEMNGSHEVLFPHHFFDGKILAQPV